MGSASPGTSPTLGIRGMICTEDYRPGDWIEVPPLLDIPPDQETLLAPTILGQYLFSLEDRSVLCLGYGSLYNHHPDPNAEVQQRGHRLVIVARRAIAPGDEIFISYGDNQDEVRRRYGF